MTRLRFSCLMMLLLTAGVRPASAADLADLVAGEVRQVLGGCVFTEGPAWHPDGYLLFTDIPNNRIIRVLPNGSQNDWLTGTEGINGLMCDQKGNVYGAQGDARQVVRLRATTDPNQGRIVEVLAAGFDGQPFNKPNDLALDDRGGLYFTDPNYRREDPVQPVEGVYYLSAAGEVARVVDDLPRPNGILVSSDGTQLYVANINQGEIVRYGISGPGQLTDGKVIFKAERSDGGGPDGMSLDERGNIYATYASLIVLTPDGELIGRIAVPEKPANCTFGGTDNKTLYITARTSLYSVPMHVAGIPLRKAGPGATSNVGFEDDSKAPEENTRKVKAGPLTLQVPASWKSEEPSNRLRLAQFSLPAAEDDRENAELVLSGPFGGSARENVERWIAQFEAEGREVTMTQGVSEQGKYIFVELAGTYNMPIGPPIRRQSKPMPGYRVLNVMLMTQSGNYFFKLAGPDKTVKSAAAALRKSFGGEPAKESEYTLE